MISFIIISNFIINLSFVIWISFIETKVKIYEKVLRAFDFYTSNSLLLLKKRVDKIAKKINKK